MGLYEWGQEAAESIKDYYNPRAEALRKAYTREGYEDDLERPEPKSAEDYFAADPYRKQIEKDLVQLRKYARYGGPAGKAAEALQKEQSAAQIALARSRGGGGAALRRGAQAGAESYVQSIPAVETAKEAERQGYSRIESAAAGMLAMNDVDFRQKLDQIMGDIARGDVAADQGEMQASTNTLAQGIGTAIKLFAGSGGDGGAETVEVKKGGVVPGEGNEDTVPAMLTPGEVVIPKELSARLMEVMKRSAGGGPVQHAQAGGVIGRDPETGYLTMDPREAALSTLASLNALPPEVAPEDSTNYSASGDEEGDYRFLFQGDDGSYVYGNKATGRLIDSEHPPSVFMGSARPGLAAPSVTPGRALLGGPPKAVRPAVPLTAEQIRGVGLTAEQFRGGGWPREAPASLKTPYSYTRLARPLDLKGFKDKAERDAWLATHAPESPGKGPASKEGRDKSAVLSLFGGSPGAYDEWWNSLKGKKPTNWGQALEILKEILKKKK